MKTERTESTYEDNRQQKRKASLLLLVSLFKVKVDFFHMKITLSNPNQSLAVVEAPALSMYIVFEPKSE
jgi:hypothetical protein